MTAPFYDKQAPAVQAVLILCEARQLWSVDEWETVVGFLFPASLDTLREIADKLVWIERLGNDAPAEVLRGYYGLPELHVMFADAAADELSARLKAEAIMNAQMIATLRLRSVA